MTPDIAVDKTEFGSITVSGRTYYHDIVIDERGKIRKRKKKLSKQVFGTSHVLSIEEAEDIYEKDIEEIIIGAGQSSQLHLSPEAENFFRKKKCQVYLLDTPGAVLRFNTSTRKKIGLFHVTC